MGDNNTESCRHHCQQDSLQKPNLKFYLVISIYAIFIETWISLITFFKKLNPIIWITLQNELFFIFYSAVVCCSVACCWVVSCWVESSVVACGWIGVPTSVVSEGASGATVSTGATSALPTILLDEKTLLTHKGHPKTYKKYEISCGFHAFCLSLHKIVCPETEWSMILAISDRFLS